MAGKKMGRPKKEIDKKQFENLCALQCTETEFCGFFGVCEDTLNSWCKENYKDEEGNPMTFSDVFAQKRGQGKIALRRYQFQQAEKNPTMAIWLGKQWLGQTDQQTTRVELVEDDPLSIAFKELTNVQQEAVTNSGISE